MSTTWFFEGAGTDPDCRILVLSGVGASDDSWKAFDDDWSSALAELG